MTWVLATHKAPPTRRCHRRHRRLDREDVSRQSTDQTMRRYVMCCVLDVREVR